jgi:hypothetical protein
MTRDKRLRRVAILCCHCLRNIAIYRAGWRGKALRVRIQFWINANSNCIDIAVLEWCKLFTERDGKHHCKAVISDRDKFRVGLEKEMGISWDQFRLYAIDVLEYRDTFVAHLDDEDTMYPPRLRLMRKSAAYLYRYLLSNEATPGLLAEARPLTEFYSTFYRHAREQYARALLN